MGDKPRKPLAFEESLDDLRAEDLADQVKPMVPA
jgi:hypothetical protein